MIVGLTGKSCSGKNHVGTILKKMGLEVWDLDVLAHDGLYANSDAIIKLFGPEIVHHEDGKDIISRKAIGKVVFSDPGMRKKLEDILYPWLRGLILDWKDSHPDRNLVLNGALLYRSGFNNLCDFIIYVDADYDVRLKRAMSRDGISEEAFRLREQSQSDVDFRDVDYGVPLEVVTNNNTHMDKLNQQVFNICDRLGMEQHSIQEF